ncbi:unnamed protein product [Miscanthus lutarioriparius]|uniref:Retroviral polymerase SH3-like domain-containing protein n=1 Tax=Miscanthus lutarioriparius TaxID=422564 RepID=A0A811NKI8_9POAL|nr:unnamed protein product [Miscanthus lutarioriparius]
MFCDVKNLSVDDLVVRLRVAEERMEKKVEQITDKAGRLLLAEEDWLEKHRHRFHSNQKEGGSSGGSQGKGKAPSHADASGSAKTGTIKLTSEGTPRRKGRCRNCGIYGHWAEDYKRPKKQKKEEKREEANVAVVGADHNPALLLAVASGVSQPSPEVVHLSEKKVIPVACPEGVWVSLRELGRRDVVSGMPIVDRVEQVCDSCVMGKQHRAPFPCVSTYRAERGLELFHTDLCGQISPPTPGGKSYFLLIVDDHSRFMWVEMLRSKDEALQYFRKKIGPGIKKLSDRSQRMVFIGYEEGTKGYRLLDPVTRTLHISRDVIFEENLGWDWNNAESLNQPEFVITEHSITVGGPTTESEAADSVPNSPAVGSLVGNQFQPSSADTQGSTSVHTPDAQTPPAQEVNQWATPPQGLGR